MHMQTFVLWCAKQNQILVCFFVVVVREPLAQIKLRASEAKRCLEIWKQSYLDVRKRIEQSGRDARWEFDRRRLFERSDHITQICTDIYNIAQVRC